MSLPSALRPLRCNQPDCTLPEGGRCARAAEYANPLNECIELLREDPSASRERIRIPILEGTSSAPEPPRGDAAPWRGRHLDVRETQDLLQRSPARLIAVLGPFNAGKTCLLASFFLQMANGQHADLPYRFAHSRTLHGFRELVERAARWSGKSEENIVLHTSKEQGELPGQFLHLGLRPRNEADDRHVDVLLTDVAGEWISDWSTRADDESRRRLAFIPRTDGFIIVADADALLGASGRRVDHDTSQLVRRILGEMRKDGRRRALALVLSKFDRVLDRVPLPDPGDRSRKEAWGPLAPRMAKIWTALEQARSDGLAVDIFPASAFPKPLAAGQPAGVLAPFIHVLDHADRRERWPYTVAPIPDGARMFHAMRRWRDTDP
jgi:hypothetical protein